MAEVLAELQRQGLLSDERFLESYVEERMRKGFGPLRIRAELRERGIGDESIDAALDFPAQDWQDVLIRVHDKKYGRQPPSDRTELARRARFLRYRGFTAEQVSRLFPFDEF